MSTASSSSSMPIVSTTTGTTSQCCRWGSASSYYSLLFATSTTTILLLGGATAAAIYLWKNNHSSTSRDNSDATTNDREETKVLQERLDALQITLQQTSEELEKQQKLRNDERSGRIHAEKLLRQQLNELRNNNGYTYQVIGTIDSPFIDRRGTPRQPLLVPAAKAYIRFNKQLIQKAHYEELKQFSHVWVIFVFHENTNLVSDQQGNGTSTSSNSPPPKLAKIRPPRLHGQKVGCLSTRSPHRPNEIGLSVCEIVSVGPDYLELRAVDMVHGTPILDVKPYIPYDVIPSNYVLPMAVSANGTPLPVRTLEVPAWVVESDIPMLPVHISDKAMEFIHWATEKKKLKFCKTEQDVIELITQVLRQDVRGVYQGRGKITDGNTEASQATTAESSNSLYQCRLDAMDISFVTLETGIEVVGIELVLGNKTK